MKWAWMVHLMWLEISYGLKLPGPWLDFAASAKTAAPKSALQREVPEAVEVLQMARFSSLIYYYKVLVRKGHLTL